MLTLHGIWLVRYTVDAANLNSRGFKLCVRRDETPFPQIIDITKVQNSPTIFEVNKISDFRKYLAICYTLVMIGKLVDNYPETISFWGIPE
jgi:hypothetical protein